MTLPTLKGFVKNPLGQSKKGIKMKSDKTIKLSKTEIIVGAWAEQARGSGWSNTLIWYCVYDSSTGQHEVRSLQPEDQTLALSLSFKVLAAGSEMIMAEIKSLIDPN